MTITGVAVVLILLEEILITRNDAFFGVGAGIAVAFVSLPLVTWWRYRSWQSARLIGLFSILALLAVGFFLVWAYFAIGGGP
jgi:hypothetical protein